MINAFPTLKRSALPSMFAWMLAMTGAGTARAEEPVNEEQEARTNSCRACHREQDEVRLKRPVQRLMDPSAGDAHAKAGLSCADCHGGDATKGMASGTAQDAHSKDFRGKPSRAEVPAFCGRCHSDIEQMRAYNPSARTDQLAEYRTSVHGKRLAAGDKNVAVCTDCHGAPGPGDNERSGHGIRAVKDSFSPVYKTNVPATCGRCHADAAYMKGYGIPTDQYEKYRRSVHGVRLFEDHDMSVPACNNCHGNHGAIPPGVKSVARVCGQCHASQEEDFQGSAHLKVFEQRNQPGCVTCHGRHDIAKPSDEMLRNENPQVISCVACHAKGDRCWRATDDMLDSLTRLKTGIDDAVSILDQADSRGMNVTKPRFDLVGAREKLTLARARLHRFNAAEVEEIAEAGMEIAKGGRKAGEAALGDYTFRRQGMAAAAVVIAADIAVLLWIIRRRRKKTA
jgi:hypothetical protein